MIVCHCHAVTDREIRRAAERGATTPREVGQHCQAGTCCGGCVPVVETILEQHGEAESRQSHALASAGLVAAG